MEQRTAQDYQIVLVIMSADMYLVSTPNVPVNAETCGRLKTFQNANELAGPV